MQSLLICTFIGEDKPGLVNRFAQAIQAQQGNWLESSMAHLAGHFAGIIRFSVDEKQLAAAREALLALKNTHLSIHIHDDQYAASDTAQSAQQTPRQQYQLSIVGNDRPGIIQEITQALSQAHINVVEMNTHLSSAPMSGELLFHSKMTLAIPQSTDLDALENELDNIANPTND